jgi:hypothetical protein
VFEWRKSSRSGSQGCVELALNVSDVRAVRDSKNRSGAMLMFEPSTLDAFLREVKTGRFDRD